jgi:predicted  nucleic acid-binding Zn-ribbon protein
VPALALAFTALPACSSHLPLAKRAGAYCPTTSLTLDKPPTDTRPAPSNNNLLFLLDTPELPQTPSRESSQNTVATSVSSTEPSKVALEKQQRWSRRSLNSPDMESLKRKLTNTRRPEPTTRNLLPELNQYKQNNAALQTQIGSLMAKLNESRKNEKSLKATLQNAEQKCLEWEQKASAAEELAKNALAFQNTVDHLEHRLEMANMEKLDAEEELFNLRMHRSPFGDNIAPHLQGQVTALKEVRAPLHWLCWIFQTDHFAATTRTRPRRKHKHRVLSRRPFRPSTRH